MWSGTTHAMEPLALTACGLTWCRPQTLGPATMAPYPSPTQNKYQYLTAHGTTICETINPLPVKPLTPTLQEDLHCQGNHQLLVELPAQIGQMGTPPLKQPPFVEFTCLYVLNTFCVVDLNYNCTCLCMYLHVGMYRMGWT